MANAIPGTNKTKGNDSSALKDGQKAFRSQNY